MTTTASIAELQRGGVILEAVEAVAITQQLIQALRQSSSGGALEPPYGPPTASNVMLSGDGSVSCTACGTTPAISEIAIFLDSLVPAGSPRVPGGLRYLIARGLLEVDVAPFDSLDELAEALKRHERGERSEVIRCLLKRAEPQCAGALVLSGDRRRGKTTATDLRRALRDADARLYSQQVVVWTPVAQPPPSRTRTAPAIAACIGSGLLLIVAGEFMYGRGSTGATEPVLVTSSPAASMKAEPVDAPAMPAIVADPAPEPAPVAPPARATPPRQASVVRVTSPARESARPVPRVWPEPRERSPAKPPRPSATINKAHGQRPGVMDRLRLGWLRNAFKSDSL
jgi:hypothetical protein